MPATLTSTGTFTDLSGVISTARRSTAPGGGYSSKDRGNEPDIENWNLDSLKTLDGVRLSELDQFVTLVAQAYNLHFWQAATLVQVFMRALMQSFRTTTTLGDEYNSRLFIP